MASLKPSMLRHCQCRYFSTSLQRLRKPNIQKPRVPHTERRILNAITVPILPPDLRPLPQQCFDQMMEKKEQRRNEVMEAYNAFRVREAVRMFENNKMIAICHALPVNDREYQALRAKVVTSGFQLMFVRNNLAREAIKDSRFANLSPYMTSKTAYVLSEEVKLVELVKLLKKVPMLALLGGVVEERILSKDQIMNAAKLPPLDTLRGELLTILSSSASKTSRLLSRHTQELSANLTQLVKQGSGEGESTSQQCDSIVGEITTEGKNEGTENGR